MVHLSGLDDRNPSTQTACHPLAFPAGRTPARDGGRFPKPQQEVSDSAEAGLQDRGGASIAAVPKKWMGASGICPESSQAARGVPRSRRCA